MKTIKSIVSFGLILFATSTMSAQISLNVNIGNGPSWGPVGYANAGYYYLPEIETYYDLRNSQFIYLDGRSWVRSRYVPRQYRNYDLNNGYKVVLNNYHGSRPYDHFKNDRKHYYKGYKGERQRTIGDYRNQQSDYNRSRSNTDSRKVNYAQHDNGNHYGKQKEKKGKKHH